jgi:hypothetical protein
MAAPDDRVRHERDQHERLAIGAMRTYAHRLRTTLNDGAFGFTISSDARANPSPIPEHCRNKGDKPPPSDLCWSRLGESNPGPTHYR